VRFDVPLPAASRAPAAVVVAASYVAQDPDAMALRADVVVIDPPRARGVVMPSAGLAAEAARVAGYGRRVDLIPADRAHRGHRSFASSRAYAARYASGYAYLIAHIARSAARFAVLAANRCAFLQATQVFSPRRRCFA